MQLHQQLVDVGRMQAGAGFVEHVQAVAALRPLQFGSELDPLCFAARQLGGGLAQAQRIKLATELQRPARSATLYLLDEPTTGLHPADVDKLLVQLHALADAGHTVVLVEHEMRVAAQADWVIDVGPGAGEEGGHVVAEGPPAKVAQVRASRTAPYLEQALRDASA